MNDTEYLNEFYKHISTDSILVVTKTGELIRLYCPFEVASKVRFPEIEAGEIVMVEEVRISQDGKDIYIINAHGYYATHFHLIDGHVA